MAIKRESITHEILSSYWIGVLCTALPLVVLFLFGLSGKWLHMFVWIFGLVLVFFAFKYLVAMIYKSKSRVKTIKEIYGKGVEMFVGAAIGGISALAWFFIVLEIPYE